MKANSELNTNKKTMSKLIRNQKIVNWLWISFLSLGLLIFVFLLLIYNGVIGYMPPIEELEDPHEMSRLSLWPTSAVGRWISCGWMVASPTPPPAGAWSWA